MNNSFKNLFNKTDTIIAIIIFAMIAFLWNAADNFDSVSDLFAQIFHLNCFLKFY